MEKIFLSHSSEDKEYVRTLVKYLGRSKVIFDEISFAPGVDFRISITKGLSESSTFAFLASKNSLASHWCKWEWEAAELRLINEKLRSCITIIIDESVQVKELPIWMRSSKVIKQTKPSLSYIDIQQHALSVGQDEDKPQILGREDLKKEFKDAISTFGEEKNVYIFHGIEGIGRKSISQKVCEEYLATAIGPVLIIEENYREEDLYLLLSEYSGISLTKENLASELNSFRTLSKQEQLVVISERMATILQSGHTPCFFDRGGMLDEDGSFKEEYQSILKGIESDQSLVILLRRKPILDEEVAEHALSIKVGPLEKSDMVLIMRQLSKKHALGLIQDQLLEITDYLDGYPPSAHFATQFMREYGPELLLTDKSHLIDFKAKRFLKFIRDLKFTDNEKRIVKYLAGENPLSIETISIALDLRIGDVASSIKRLIDLSLLNSFQSKYAINTPLADAIHKVLGLIPIEEYANITKRLTDAYWRSEELSPTLDVVDATFHALYRGGSGSLDEYSDIVRPSILHDISQQAYYSQQWVKALDYADRALSIDAENEHLLEIRFKALVKLERWVDAEETLAKVKRVGGRHYFYLSGFLAKARKRIDQAAEMFQLALDTGDRSIPVYRDFADCWFRKGKYKESLSLLDSIFSRSQTNPFIIDQYVKIYLELGDSANVLKFLNILESIDLDRKFIEHRKARYFALIGDKVQALIHAEAAFRDGQERFEVIGEIASIYIDLGRFDEAREYLAKLNSKFSDQKKDVQNGLNLKLLVREGKLEAAQACYDRLVEKDLPVHKALLRQILELKLRKGVLSLTERGQIQEQISVLSASISGPAMFTSEGDSAT